MLIAIFTGARRNEICSLMVSDVKQDEETGIWYFDINENISEGKQLKTQSSKRLIPIHSKLIDLGFLEYLEQAKEKVKNKDTINDMQPRLLYDVGYGRDGWARDLGRFFNERFLPKLDLHDKNNKTLHSLRHSFNTYLLREGINLETVQALLGHESKATAIHTYRKYDAEDLPLFKNAIEKLPY